MLPGLLIGQSLNRTQLCRTGAVYHRCFPSRQHLIPHLRIPMPQPMHVAQPRRLALPVVNMPLLDV